MDYETVRKLKDQRDYHDKVLETEQNKKEKVCKLEGSFDTIYSRDFPMEINELMKFGENLDNEYKQLLNNSRELKGKNDPIGIPYHLMEEATKFHFKSLYFENKKEEKEERVEYLTTAEGNVKNEYYRSMAKIISFGIEIWKVEKDLLKFKNRGTSSLCDNTCVYKFYCKRNHYKFVVEFIDDCDCEPGLLYIRKVIDSRTGDEIAIRCDLYCHNTGRYELKNFLTLIGSESLVDYVNKRYSRLLDLLKYLEERSIEVDERDKKQFSNPKELIESYNYLIFRLSTFRGNCMILLPYFYTDETSDYIFVGPTVEHYNINQKMEFLRIKGEDDNVKIGSNEFYNDYRKYCFFTKLDDSKSNENIIELITCYFDDLEGKNGYEQDGAYYTDKDIKVFLNVKKKERIRYLDFKNFSDYYNGPMIGIVTCIYPDNYYSGLSYHEGYLYNIDYPFDSYKLTFWYDRNETECHLLVQGKYRLINHVAKEYYKTNKIENIKENNVFEPFELRGTFTEVFDQFKDIILELIRIFESKNENQDKSKLLNKN